GAGEESLVGIWSRHGHSVRSYLSSTISPDDPVRVQERKLGMLSDRVDVPRCQKGPFPSHLPVFASEVEIAILRSDSEHVGDPERASSRAIYQEPGLNWLAAVL